MNPKNPDSLLQKVINYSFYSLFFFVPFLFYTGNSELFEFNKMVGTYALTVLITGAWIGRCVLHGKFLFTKTVLDIPLLLFLLSLLLSTFFSIDRHTSIWGYYSRSNGGLLSIMSYLLLYWAYVSNIEKEEVKLHTNALLGSSIVISIYAILEHFGYSFSCVLVKGEFNTDCWVQDVRNRVFATLGQPNWLAAWLTAIAPLGWLELKSWRAKEHEKNKFKLILLYSYTLILFLAILFTKSRSGLLGFTAAFGVFWFFSFSFSKNRLALLKSFVICNLSFVILLAVFGSPWTPRAQDVLANFTAKRQALLNSRQQFNKKTIQPLTTPKESGTVLESGGTESFAIRQVVWKGAINVWRAYPLFGSGVETFAYSYYQYRPVEHNQTSEWDFLYNKAHNEYLNYLSTTGIFGLGSYLLIIVTFLVWSLKRIPQSLPFLAGFASILVTNYAGFSIVPTATLFYMFPAMAFVLVQSEKNKGQSKSLPILNLKSKLYLSFVLCTMFYVLLQIWNVWYADLKYATADRLTRRGLPHYAVEPFGDAITLRPDEPLYYSKYATTISQIATTLAEENEATRAAEIAKDADSLQSKALSISPRNIPIIKDAHTNYLLLAGIDDKYLQRSHQLIEYLLELSPTDPRVYYLLGQSYLRIGQKEKAIEALNKALELKSDFPDPREILVQLESND